MPQKLEINYAGLRSKVIAKVSYKNRIKSIDIFLVFSFFDVQCKIYSIFSKYIF